MACHVVDHSVHDNSGGKVEAIGMRIVLLHHPGCVTPLDHPPKLLSVAGPKVLFQEVYIFFSRVGNAYYLDLSL